MRPGAPGHPLGPAACDGAAGLPGLGMRLLLAEEEQSGFILSSQMLVMLPTFLFTEANPKHLFFFRFSDMRHGEVHFCAAPNPKRRPSLAWGDVPWHPTLGQTVSPRTVRGVCGSGCL